MFGLPPATLRNWGQGRSHPDAPTRVLREAPRGCRGRAVGRLVELVWMKRPKRWGDPAVAPYVSHDLVRRLSAPHHAASLTSALFRDPFPPVGNSAIRDAIHLHLQFSYRNRLNPHLSDHFIPAIIPGNPPISVRQYLSQKPVTGCISMKTLVRFRIPFFPSCIMVLGALVSPDYAACGDTPVYTPAPAVRL